VNPSVHIYILDTPCSFTMHWKNLSLQSSHSSCRSAQGSHAGEGGKRRWHWHSLWEQSTRRTSAGEWKYNKPS